MKKEILRLIKIKIDREKDRYKFGEERKSKRNKQEDILR